ncbi:Unknown [Streptococcus agalactiae NEM316]|uniref:Uncharacterized protein n=1 Tax=Streptococcus agalactiae serotype III (strain NEM316) TaxID=211110 RepID=Q8E5A8_STRA3|nr:Unknown [Streptococcus agalactiae NEM316]
MCAFFKTDTLKSCAIDQNAGSKKSATLQIARRVKKGIGDFPKTEKGNSLIVGYPQIGLSPFLFSHVSGHVLRLPENKSTELWEDCQILNKGHCVEMRK